MPCQQSDPQYYAQSSLSRQACLLAPIYSRIIAPGVWVVVAGAGGGLGHLALQLGSRGMGFRMIGLDVGSKEELARECGAEVFIDVTKTTHDKAGDGVAKAFMEATGKRGAAAVVVCSGSNEAYAQSLSYLKFNGTLVCVGVPAENVPIANS